VVDLKLCFFLCGASRSRMTNIIATNVLDDEKVWRTFWCKGARRTISVGKRSFLTCMMRYEHWLLTILYRLCRRSCDNYSSEHSIQPGSSISPPTKRFCGVWWPLREHELALGLWRRSLPLGCAN
jgi:hypothetical protein